MAEFIALAKGLDRGAFMAKFTHPFLLTDLDGDSLSQIAFRTVTATASQIAKKATRGARVVPLVKAAANPYSDRISIGRALNCDIILRDPSVSKLHAHIRQEANGTLSLVDLNSHNGTVVGDTPVEAGQPVAVHLGDVIHFGQVKTRLVDSAQLYGMLTGAN